MWGVAHLKICMVCYSFFNVFACACAFSALFMSSVLLCGCKLLIHLCVLVCFHPIFSYVLFYGCVGSCDDSSRELLK